MYVLSRKINFLLLFLFLAALGTIRQFSRHAARHVHDRWRMRFEISTAHNAILGVFSKSMYSYLEG